MHEPPAPVIYPGFDVSDVLGGLADLATIALTALAIVTAVWVGLRQIRASRPNVVLTYQFHVEANPKTTGRTDGKLTSPLVEARHAWVRASQLYPTTDYFRWSRLRVTVTNDGGAPISVESIGWETTVRGMAAASGAAGTPTYPHLLSPHHYVTADRVYRDVLAEASGAWVRGFANLSNGQTAYGPWVQLDPSVM